jgi:hypothetical protein
LLGVQSFSALVLLGTFNVGLIFLSLSMNLIIKSVRNAKAEAGWLSAFVA